MNVFNVHVNRVPCDGTVTRLAYRPGKFFNAAFDKASEHNERMSIRLAARQPGGAVQDLAFVQIAGLIARRIVAWSKEGCRLERGERLGMIRFGSRTEVFVPLACTVLVKPGDRVEGAATPIARWPAA